MRDVEWLIPIVQEKGTDLLLFSCCDSVYLEYVVSLIKSVEAFSPGLSFVLHIVNPNKLDEKRLQELASILTFTKLAVSYERIDLSMLKGEQWPAYYASARFPQLATLLHEYQCPIFSLDADSLIVNPIDYDFSDKDAADIVLVRRDQLEDMPEHLSVATGSIWLKPNKHVCQFLSDLAVLIDKKLKAGSLTWFDDQILFYQQMKMMNKKLRIYNLKRKYADWDFRGDSIVWAGKGSRKEDDLRFYVLQAMLSDNRRRNGIAKSIKSDLFSSDKGMSNGSWLGNRYEIAARLTRKIRNNVIDIYVPRLDLPWIQREGARDSISRLSKDITDLRLHWKEFAIGLANAIERAGVMVNVIELPLWEVDRERIEASGSALALIPHRCVLNFDQGTTPVIFYMQEYFRSVFVVDEEGWSAASSKYPIDLESLPVNEKGSFEIYRQRLNVGELGSKFAQAKRTSRTEFISSGKIPVKRNWFGRKIIEPYIFFPLQIPHDQSIRYFSDVTEMEVVEVLVNWAREKNIPIVLKPHPANRKSMRPFRELVDGRAVFWSEAHVYDLIKYSSAVYTINSGVGFESLLQCKPIITFGKAEYDCVTFNANFENLDEAWEYCLDSNFTLLEERYRKFVDWFLGDYAVDLSQSDRSMVRFDEIAKNIVSRAKEKVLNFDR